MQINYTSAGMEIDGNLITWETIDLERNKLQLSKCVLVEIGFNYGLSSSFHDSFIMDSAEWADLKEEMGSRTIYFGEIAGKHSEVYLPLTQMSVKETTDFEEINLFFQRNKWRDGNVCVRSTYEENKDEGRYDD